MFRDQIFEKLDREEEYLKQINRELRDFDIELRDELSEIRFLEELINRLEQNIQIFDNDHLKFLSAYLKDLNSKESKNPLRVYSHRIDACISAFLEIEFDFLVFEHIVNKLPKHYIEGRSRKLSGFHQVLGNEFRAFKKLVGSRRLVLFGKEIGPLLDIDYTNLSGN